MKRFFGRSKRGRVAKGVDWGISYCAAHYEQIRNGKTPKAIRKPRGRGPYARGVDDAAAIADFHGHAELAALLRRLNP